MTIVIKKRIMGSNEGLRFKLSDPGDVQAVQPLRFVQVVENASDPGQ